MILVKIYEKETVDSSLYASVSLPNFSEEFEIDEGDRGSIFDTMSAYDPDKYMVVVSYSQMSDTGSRWIRLASFFDALHADSGTPSLDHIIGKA